MSVARSIASEQASFTPLSVSTSMSQKQRPSVTRTMYFILPLQPFGHSQSARMVCGYSQSAGVLSFTV
jgi:hypothetical protein